MRRIEANLFSIGLWILFAGVNCVRAEDSYRPAETPAPQGLAPGARPHEITFLGVRHTNALGKPCLEIAAFTRAHLVNQQIFDYVVSITNKCPKQIKVRMCNKGSFDCNSVAVPAYQFKELVMDFGPQTDRFNFTAKEGP